MDGAGERPDATGESEAAADEHGQRDAPTRRRALADGRVVEVAVPVSDAELTAIAAALERRVPTPVWRRAGIAEAVSGTALPAPDERWGGGARPRATR